MEEPKTFSEEYVKELREEAKQWRLKFREAEQKLQELQESFSKKELDFTKQIENLSEKVKSVETLQKELELYKPKAQKLEEKIKNNLLSLIPDEELKKQALEKYQDIEQLEFYVQSLQSLIKSQPSKSSMDTSQKNLQASVETEYQKALQEGNVLKAIALKNKMVNAS